MANKLQIGKIPENILKRSIFKKINVKRPEVLVHSGVGEDCSILSISDENIVLSTDPITGTANDLGKLAFHITANDIASAGAQLVGILVTIILVPDSDENDLKKIMDDISNLCNEYNIEILGGHTEVSDVVNQNLVSVTGVGKTKNKRLIRTSGLLPGQDLVLTKWIGLEGSSIIAKDMEEYLKGKLPTEIIENSKDFDRLLSVSKEAQIAMDFKTDDNEEPVTAMHDVTEGGIFGALWEMADASNTGLEVDLKKIPIKQETIELSEVFDINPYMLISSGSMLIGCFHGDMLVEELEKNGINAKVIGHANKTNDKVIINGSEKRYLEPPAADEIYKVLKERDK